MAVLLYDVYDLSASRMHSAKRKRLIYIQPALVQSNNITPLHAIQLRLITRNHLRRQPCRISRLNEQRLRLHNLHPGPIFLP